MRRNYYNNPIDGWLIIDKPLNWTSTSVVNTVRRTFRAKKAGHAGTLDPLATGVLPIAFGNATKTIPYVMNGQKTYRFTLIFGQQRTTDDAEGEILRTSHVLPTEANITSALVHFRGVINQTPPAFSAIRISGKRAYELARQKKNPILASRQIRIDKFDLISMPSPDRAIFEVDSGKGAYMRSLGRDLALACDSCGYITDLRRLKVGPFTENDTLLLDKILANPQYGGDLGLLLPIGAALADIPALALTYDEATDFGFGRAIDPVCLAARLPMEHDSISGAAVVAMYNDHIIGICRFIDGMVRPVRVFNITT